MRGMATLPQGNQESLVVRDKVRRLPGELGVSKSMECDISLQCFDTVGWVTGRASACKKAGCGFVGGDDLTGALHVRLSSISSPVVTTTSIILCFNKFTQANLDPKAVA